jgi:pentatricopeptide repeat protein
MEDAQNLFNRMPERNVFARSAMILGYVKCGQGQRALELSRKMLEDGVEPNPITFVGMLNACASEVALEEGRSVHQQVIAKGYECDTFVSSSLIDMYVKCGSIEDALIVFNKISKPSVVAWSAIILGYVRFGQGLKALELSRQMQLSGVEPNPYTFVGILNACASISALEEGKRVHQRIKRNGCESDLFVANSLIDMYAKCGSLLDAQEVFTKMFARDVVSWNAMLGAYAMHGDAYDALEIFEEMTQKGVAMDRVTFVSLLSACSHAGLVDEGLLLLDYMTSVCNVSATAEHYTCIVDLLGRAGRLHEAEDNIEGMVESDSSVWMPLLGACRIHSNLELGERVAKSILDFDPENDACLVLLSNIYAAAGKWDSSANIQNQRMERGLKKQPGRTWIEVNNEVHSFTADDQEHPQKEEIIAELERLNGKMKEAGYIPDLTFVLHNVDEGEKVHQLSHHSEKLAIAFGLINTPPNTPLRIFKNRSIIVRDATRFHHFEDGVCSCKDYW